MISDPANFREQNRTNNQQRSVKVLSAILELKQWETQKWLKYKSQDYSQIQKRKRMRLEELLHREERKHQLRKAFGKKIIFRNTSMIDPIPNLVSTMKSKFWMMPLRKTSKAEIIKMKIFKKCPWIRLLQRICRGQNLKSPWKVIVMKLGKEKSRF